MRRQNVIIWLLVISLACNLYVFVRWRKDAAKVDYEVNNALISMMGSMRQLEWCLMELSRSKEKFGALKTEALTLVSYYKVSAQALARLESPLGVASGTGLHFLGFTLHEDLSGAISRLESADDIGVANLINKARVASEVLENTIYAGGRTLSMTKRYFSMNDYDQIRDRIQSGLE